MDDVQLIRKLADDVERLDPARRTALSRRVEPRTLAARESRRRARRRTATALAGACAVSVLMAASWSDMGTTPAPLATATANPVLVSAARTAESHATAPIPEADQFIYTRDLLREIPVGGGPVETFVDESWRAVDPARYASRIGERGRSWLSGPGMTWPTNDYEVLSGLPTDPVDLRARVLEHVGGGVTPAQARESEIMGLMMLLQNWRIMPADLRGAIFRALAVLPEVRVRHGVEDALGRRGIGISGPPAAYGYELVLDPESFEYLGMRGVSVRSDGVAVEQAMALTDYGVVDAMDAVPQPAPLENADGGSTTRGPGPSDAVCAWSGPVSPPIAAPRPMPGHGRFVPPALAPPAPPPWGRRRFVPPARATPVPPAAAPRGSALPPRVIPAPLPTAPRETTPPTHATPVPPATAPRASACRPTAPVARDASAPPPLSGHPR